MKQFGGLSTTEDDEMILDDSNNKQNLKVLAASARQDA